LYPDTDQVHIRNSPRERGREFFAFHSQLETTMIETAASTGKRWASRKEAMAHMRVGSTRMNELMQSQAILAKKDGGKVIVCLDSCDSYYEALPRIGARLSSPALG
jgi:hypothetical protein